MSAGNSFLWETCGPNVFRGEYHDSFPIDLMCKDNQLGYEMARQAGVPLEVLGLMQQIYNRGLYSLGPDVGCYAPPMAPRILIACIAGTSTETDRRQTDRSVDCRLRPEDRPSPNFKKD